MEQVALIKIIQEDIVLHNEDHGTKPGDIYVRPAWKEAYYNPAKKTGNGEVIVKPLAVWMGIPFYIIAIITIVILSQRNYLMLLVPAAAVAGILFYGYQYPAPSTIVNAIGITYKNRTFKWADLNGVFIASWLNGRQAYFELILLHTDGKLMYIRLPSGYSMAALGTAIRDFQPADWKPLSRMKN